MGLGTESVLPRSRSYVRRARKMPPSSHSRGENRGWVPWLSQSMYLNVRTPHELVSPCLGKYAGGLCSSRHSLTFSRACTAAGSSDFFVWEATTVQSSPQVLPFSSSSSTPPFESLLAVAEQRRQQRRRLSSLPVNHPWRLQSQLL